MGDPASVTVKNLLGLAGVILVTAIIINLLMGIMGEVAQKSTVKWIDDEISPRVSGQCKACFWCIGGEDPKPKDGRLKREFNSDDIKLEWKGKNGHQLHFVTMKDGEIDLSVPIAVDQDGVLLSGINGCDSDKVEIQGNHEDPGIKSFKIKPNDRGAIIDIE